MGVCTAVNNNVRYTEYLNFVLLSGENNEILPNTL